VAFFCKQALNVDDVVDAVVYILSAKPHVQVTVMNVSCSKNDVVNITTTRTNFIDWMLRHWMTLTLTVYHSCK